MLAIGEGGLTRRLRRPWLRVTLVAPRAAAAAGPSGGLRRLLAVGAAYAVLLGLGVASAHAELMFSTTFGSEGTGDGQFLGPRGIGVDQTTLGPSSGDVYVADTGNARVEQFDSAGSFIRMWGWGVADGASSFEVCTSACQAGQLGAGAGQFSSPTSIAVDSSSGPTQGDIYVGDYVNKVVDKFSPSGSLLATITGPSEGTLFTTIAGVAVDTNGNLWVADESTNIVYEFDSSGTLLSQFNDAYGNTEGVAVDAAGEIYLIRGSGDTEKWSPAARAGGTPVEVDSPPGTGLAVDFSTNNLYVDRGASIDQWEAPEKSLGNFGSGWLSQGAQLAYNPNISLPGAAGPGALYVADPGGNHVAVFVPPAPAAPAVPPNSENATSVTTKAATINASVNADGLDTHVYFEYGPTSAYGTSTPVPPGTDIGSNFGSVAAAASLSGLSASTTYHFRVVAANALGTTDGPDMTFTTATPTAPTVNSESSVSITSTKATLQAAITPVFADTHYFFEYGPTTAYGTQVPLPPGSDIGESNTEQDVTVALTGLQPQTTYHFRVVATSSAGTTDGQDETFTTTPPLKIESAFAANVTATAADLGAKINSEGLDAHYHFEYGTTTSYGSDAPIPDGAISAAEGDQSVAVHLEGLQPNTKYYVRVVATDSFATETLDAQSFTTYAAGEPTILADDRAYERVSPTDKNGGDVGGSAVSDLLPAAQSAWAHGSVGGSAISYFSFTSFGDAQSAGLLTQYLSTRGPTGWTTRSISPSIAKHTELSLRPGYHFFTPELTAGVLSWGGSVLVPGAPEGEFENLYTRQMNAAAPYELVTNVAPPNRTSGYSALLAGASADLRHVVFSANDALVAGAQANVSNVYEWVAGSLRLVSILPGPGSVAAESAGAGNGEAEENIQENAVSADGSRIFWTDNNKQLYVREDGTTTVKLNESQRTPSLGDGSAQFRGATPGGSRVFFIDTTQLTNAPDDNGGLYEYDLSSGKLRDLSTDSSGSPEVEGVVGASEDGVSVYFVSRASLAGGATAGDYNLYLSREGVLRFIAALSSQDSNDWSAYPEIRPALVTPDGEHLAFLSQASLTGYDNTDVNTGSADNEVFLYDAGSEHLSCASCNPSGAQPVGPASVPQGQNTGHIPHFISDDGRRVFFDSKDVLLPADTNGQQNVYEYEEGAVHLISSGAGEEISTFADASANGDDVFFTTREQLVPEDTDNSSDMYDARVGGGFPVPVSSQPCAGESCRGPLSAPPAPLGIGTEVDSPAPEVLPEQPQAVQVSKAGPPKHKKRKPKKRARRNTKSKGAARKSKGSRPGRHRGKGSSRSYARGGHKS
jgi:hypothetical protein